MTDLFDELGEVGDRVVYARRSEAPGPTLISTGSVHGNEPAGLLAIRRVATGVAALDDDAFAGEWVGLAGNLEALRRRVRFVDHDFNRAWTHERTARLEWNGTVGGQAVEDVQMDELYHAMKEVRQRARGPIYFIDLHTSGAPGEPFLCIGDTLANQRFARRFPVPILLGLEEQLDGAILEHMNERGAITLGFEGGQHLSPAAVGHHESALWIALVASRIVDPARAPGYDRHVGRLAGAVRGLPRVFEVRHRHAIAAGDDFKMEPGYTNFRPVARGELLARDRRGEVRAIEGGRILLPLYQEWGDDGFFLGRDLSAGRMALGRLLRRLGLPRLLTLLPGVRSDPDQPESLRIEPLAESYLPADLFRALGYRKARRLNGTFLRSRRRIARQDR